MLGVRRGIKWVPVLESSKTLVVYAGYLFQDARCKTLETQVASSLAAGLNTLRDKGDVPRSFSVAYERQLRRNWPARWGPWLTQEK
jgi:hypothetical protein